MTFDSSLFQKYTQFVLQWEGNRSSDPGDSAAGCSAGYGPVHTVKGVTFCTFRSLASKLGVTPATYARFLDMTDADAGKFLFEYYKLIRGDQLPDLLAIAMTEAAWGSGQDRSVKHLQAALNTLKVSPVLQVDGAFGEKTLAAVRKVNPKALYKAYWEQRYSFIDNLSLQPAYSKFRRGWMNRIADFAKRFAVSPGSAFFLLTAVAVLLLIKSK